MEIKTKFKAGQEVFFILDHSVRSAYISEINITVAEYDILDIIYLVNYKGSRLKLEERFVFESKKALIESL